MTATDIDLLSIELRKHFDWHGARINFLANFLIALFKVKTVNFTQLATAFSCKKTTNIDSHYKRIQRFFRFFVIDEYEHGKAIASFIFPGKKWILTLDRTNWLYGEKNINILTLGLAHKGMAFPLLYDFLNKKGNSNTEERKRILLKFLSIFGGALINYLTADREFIGKDWFEFLLEQKISFRIRIRKTDKIANSQGEMVEAKVLFQNLKVNEHQVLEQKRSVWGHLLYVAALRLPNGELLIVVSPDCPETILHDYAVRWEIETLFGCLKSRGFNLEDTHVTKPERIKKMMAVLAIALCWSHKLGEVLNDVKPIAIKKHGRRAKSIFRTGFDSIRSILLNISERFEDYLNIIKLFMTSTVKINKQKSALPLEYNNGLSVNISTGNYVGCNS